MRIKIFTAGGTIDKVYFDAKSEYLVGESNVGEILIEANVDLEYEAESILRKDSLDMTDADRQLIFDRIQADAHDHIVVTHGTDTIVETAVKLTAIQGKTIVLTGSMAPARFKSSDAVFNIGFAVAAAQTLPHGAYIAINGRIFDPRHVRKNRSLNRFEEI
ncbi:MAG: asparaginase domain-containing protein [bacterium]